MPLSARRSSPSRTGSVVLCAAVAALVAPAVAVAAPEPPPAPCPKVAPPPAVDTSEVPPPGAAVPPPVPVPDDPVGGQRMAECGLITGQGTPPPPAEVTSESWVLADLDSGQIMAARDPHARQRPASTIKVLTALVALRELKLDDTIVATQQDADQEGSRVGLSPGVTYTVRQVLTGLIMQSGNDAAHALAMKVGGMDAMVDKMNALARELGALDTRTATPSGLDGPGMSTSAYDLALFYRAAMRDPNFAAISATRNTQLPGPPGKPPMEVWSDNQVLLHYPGAIGGKTGFTDDARHTLIGAADRGGHRLVGVMTRGENQPIRQTAQMMRLLDYGFALGPVEPVGKLVDETAKPSADHAARAGSDAAGKEPGQQSRALGSVGGPLALVVVLLAAVVGALALRRRRAAAHARRNSGGDDHP
ncbi:D-alanyl-D-alanine carboxypeptidase family protein [Saccharopolyspora rosea]|uniref:D-alanyl-D-alanine carboxypeptidase family protein n=1 Tax=Saccharopolyspora rosea TaxID=524884 RepID=A0ABW3FN97_9PSEU